MPEADKSRKEAKAVKRDKRYLYLDIVRAQVSSTQTINGREVPAADAIIAWVVRFSFLEIRRIRTAARNAAMRAVRP